MEYPIIEAEYQKEYMRTQSFLREKFLQVAGGTLTGQEYRKIELIQDAYTHIIYTGIVFNLENGSKELHPAKAR